MAGRRASGTGGVCLAAEFEKVLKAYLNGNADPRDLTDAFAADLAAGHAAEPMLALVERGVRAGRLPDVLPTLLRQRAAAESGTTQIRRPPPPAPPDGDHARLRSPPPPVLPPVPPAADREAHELAGSERTVLRMPSPLPPSALPPGPQASDPADRTVLRPAPAAPEPPAAPPPEVADAADRTVLRPAPAGPKSPAASPATADGEPDADSRTVVRVPGAVPARPPAAPPAAEADDAEDGGHTVVRMPDALPPPRETGSRTGAGTGTGSRAPTGAEPSTGSLGSASLASGASRSYRSGTGTGASYGGVRRINDRPLEVGEVINNRFMLDRELGKGGMGTVFKARDLRRDAAGDVDPFVAIKVLTPEFSRHPEAVRTLQRETKKVQGLASDYIVRVYDFDQDDSTEPPISFMTMEYLEGESLDQFIHHDVPREGLSWKEARPIVAPLALGLAYAHQRGLVHSDFKPANVFRTRQGVVKVLDFGIARIVDPEQKKRENFDVGDLGARTPAYASPEMFPTAELPNGAIPDPRDDVYALACVIYEVLTGKHPFGRKPANVARENHLLAARPRMLSNRQWQVLASGLAFDREARCRGCDLLLQGLDGDSVHRRRLLMIGGGIVAGVLVLALLVIGPVRDWLSARHIDELRNALKSGGDSADAAIREIGRLDDEERRRALADGDVQDGVVRRYLAEADTRIDEVGGRYDFKGALALIAQASEWYPRDADLVQRRRELENRRDSLLSELNQAFTQALDDNRIGPEAGDDGVSAVLARIARIDPEHRALHDPRIGPAYAEVIDAALARGDLDLSRALLDEGSRLVPGDQALTDLGDRLRLATDAALREQQISTALAALADFRPATLAEFRSRRDDLLRLQRLAPDHPRLKALELELRSRIDAALTESEARRDWAGGRVLLDEFEVLLAQDWRSDRQRRLSQAETDARARLTTLTDDIRRNAAVGRLDAARSGLGQLAAQGARPEALVAARALIARAYLDAARQARAAGRFEEARTQIAQARTLEPDPALAATLDAEAEQLVQAETASRQQLADAERQRLAAERAAAQESARQRFETALAALDGPRQAPAALAALDEYARLSPNDPLAAGGRDRIASRLAELAAAQAQSGNLDAAASQLRQGITLLPESTRLVEALGRIEQQRSAARDADEARRTRELFARLDGRLARPFADGDWSRGIAGDLRDLEARVPAGDPELGRRREALRKVYADAIEAALAGQRVADARGTLAELGRLLPGQDLGALQARIDQADARFRADQEQRRQQANIEGRKGDFVTRLRATDPDAARRALQELAKLLPADDPFLAQEAPRQLADGYLKLAAREAERRNFDRAVAVLGRARDALPDSFDAELKTQADAYRRDGTFADLRDVLDKGNPDAIAGLDRRLRDAQKQYPDDYGKQVADWPKNLAARITRTADKDAAGALALLDSARRLFPDARELAAIRIEAPVAAPSKFAPRVNDLVGAGKLGEADRVLAQGRRAEGDHPDLKLAADALEQRRDKAEAAHAGADRAKRRKDDDGQKKALQEALALWIDNAGWQKELDALMAPPPEPVKPPEPVITTPEPGKLPRVPGGPDPCEARLAGQGRRPYGVCSDTLSSGGKGPDLVVVPAGGGSGMPFAIGKYEISYEEMSAFCRSGGCSVKGGPGLPASGVSARDAERYVAWLSQQTGFSYRLPSAGEWKFAAGGGGQLPAQYNCRLTDGTRILKGESLQGTRSGQANGYGLVNVLGNVREMVRGGQALGGAYLDTYSSCSPDNAAAADEATGFRVARALK